MRRLVALLVRIFFRRVAIAGAERVPATGPVLFVLNHPNSLVDPLFLLGLAPRRVVFLAKEPLFRMPVLRHFMRWMGSIPVYRRQDAADMTKNRETFQRVWEELARGGAVALFPEGTSHSDPKLRPFKTGAARMALGAASAAKQVVRVVPSGLYYTAKATFRSSALLYFGDPIPVEPHALGSDGEPPPDLVRDLTSQLEHALAEVTLQADQQEALALVTRAERIFSSGDEESRPTRDLVAQFELRRRFLVGYTHLREHAPERLDEVRTLIAQYERRLADAGISPESLAPGRVEPFRVMQYAVRMLVLFLLVFPVAAIGIVIHYPAYRLTGPIVTGIVKPSRDLVATGKIAAAGLFFLLTWIVVGILVGTRFGVPLGMAAAALAPCTGYVALRFLERVDRIGGAARGLLLILLRPSAFRRLVEERRRIREAILELADGLPPIASAPPPP